VNQFERLPNLTRYESIGINKVYNLADGHAHQSQSSTQREIVERLPEWFEIAQSVKQSELEAEFRSRFYALAGQFSACHLPRTMFCYSASLSTDLIATYLSEHGLSVALLSPCFDNLATILMRRKVSLAPITEDRLRLENLEQTIANLQEDALFITVPNNPTGFELSREEWETLVPLCVKYNKLLIVDCTFRFFSRAPQWDQYHLLETSKVRYMVVEDTGKTWPTQDLKCSVLAVSEGLYDEVLPLHNDILLNVSPFILKLLIEYLKDSERQGLQASVWETIDRNRQALREAVESSILAVVDPDSKISVEWLAITDPHLSSMDMVNRLYPLGLGILPGDHFFWDDHAKGERFVRIALARDPVMFAQACQLLKPAIRRNDAS
jgi:aspartate/methionine/tyrosine aminotransferase